MKKDNEIQRAIDIIGGVSKTASLCGVTRRAVYRWKERGKLPRTEATGETQYADKMSRSDKRISKKKLLDTVRGG